MVEGHERACSPGTWGRAAVALGIERTKMWYRLDGQADKDIQGVSLRMGDSNGGMGAKCHCHYRPVKETEWVLSKESQR